MERNVYSLVLIDDIVNAVDKMAYERNTSRSNLINQILAEYFSFPTPEMRMKNIFDCVEQMMEEMENFQIQFQPSDAMISIRSALHYRYNPTIRYVLELYRCCEPTVGELRVSMRTQSQPLIHILTDFFRFWADLEDKIIGSVLLENRVPCQVETGRYLRKFVMPKEENQRTNENIANAIGKYIQLFDTSLKYYFSGLDDLASTMNTIEKNYQNYMEHEVII